jgi:hypothetical protein
VVGTDVRNGGPLLGVEGPLPNPADGPLCVLERAPGRLALGLVGPARRPVLEEDAGHDEGIEPGGSLFAFLLPVEDPVTAPGQIKPAAPLRFSFASQSSSNCFDSTHVPKYDLY